ncbi:hypothetical protein N7486_009924 [Penicillium sp. IBT 16267x]|nr:hypothetical protein N7486_009924 [Penicillium sp. IBT 16267x]
MDFGLARREVTLSFFCVKLAATKIKFPTATEGSPLAHVDFELCEMGVGVGPFLLEKGDAVFHPVDFALELIGK